MCSFPYEASLFFKLFLVPRSNQGHLGPEHQVTAVFIGVVDKRKCTPCTGAEAELLYRKKQDMG